MGKTLTDARETRIHDENEEQENEGRDLRTRSAAEFCSFVH